MARVIQFGNTRFISNYGTENTFVGLGSGALIIAGDNNTALGFEVLKDVDQGSRNTSVGAHSLQDLTDGDDNCAFGTGALADNITGNGNTAVGSGAAVTCTGSNNTGIGFGALLLLAGGDENTSLGSTSLAALTTGNTNTAIGYGSGSAYTSNESDNIVIGNLGVITDNNTIRLGNYATVPGAGQQNKTYISAAYSNIGTSNTFVGELAGNDTLTIVSATQNTFVGNQSGNSVTTGSSNVAVGSSSLKSVTAGHFCVAVGHGALLDYQGTGGVSEDAHTAVGALALFDFTTGNGNTAIGGAALSQLVTGDENVAVGWRALQSSDPGNFNTCIGTNTGNQIDTGDFNTCLGYNAGSVLDSSDSDNIAIGHVGVNGDNNTMRIGTSGSGSGQQNRTFIAGIRGITTDVNDAIAVLVDSAGQLGTVSSSIRFKDNVRDMGSDSQAIMNLRPVVFNYKGHAGLVKNYGLIAEEVHEVFPSLVVYDDKGPLSVKYHELPSLLLNEIQKLNKRIEELEKKLK